MKIICGVQLTLTVVFFTLWLKMRSYLSWKKYIDAGEDEDDTEEKLEVIQETVEDDEEDIHGWMGKVKAVFKPVKSKLAEFS